MTIKAELAERGKTSKWLREKLHERYGERLTPNDISVIINGKESSTPRAVRILKEIEIIFSEM